MLNPQKNSTPSADSRTLNEVSEADEQDEHHRNDGDLLPALRSIAGELRQRLPETIQQVRELAGRTDREVLNRAEIDDGNSPIYLRTETLICWIRARLRINQDDEMAWGALEVIVKRSKRTIDRRTRYFLAKTEAKSDAEQEILDLMFRQIIDTDGHVWYWEVHFNDCLEKLCKMVTKKYNVVEKRETPFSAYIDAQAEGEDEVFGVPDPRSLEMEAQAETDDFLAALPDRERGIVLSIQAGYSQQEAAEHYGVSDRTVRNVLRALQKLWSSRQIEAESVKGH